ncbi:MAG: Spy/CpxP family protein refolding chaperone [Thiohalomonadaceae bacterium]
MNNVRTWINACAGLLLALTAGSAWAQPGPGDCPGYGMGPGMMGGIGMMGGMGPGYGMGHPMMGGMGMGYGMGPGMMGGMGPGYGYGYGYGWGMGLAGLDLNDDQRKAINQIVDQHRKRQHDLLGKLADQQAQLRDQYQREKWDANAITKIYDQMADVRREMIRSRIEMRNQIYDRLTPEQRKQFRRGWVD